jgi:Fe-S-cluster-containing hydrogenase component 2
VAGCETSAITEGETQSHIDVMICIECGTCQINCPSDAIIFVEETETTFNPAPKKPDRNNSLPMKLLIQ